MSDKLPFFFFQFSKQGSVLVLKYETHSCHQQPYSAVYSTGLNYENYEKLLTRICLNAIFTAGSQLGESSELPVAPPRLRQFFLELVTNKSYASGQRQGMSLKHLHSISVFSPPLCTRQGVGVVHYMCYTTTLPHPPPFPPTTHFIIKILAKLIMP